MKRVYRFLFGTFIFFTFGNFSLAQEFAPSSINPSKIPQEIISEKTYIEIQEKERIDALLDDLDLNAHQYKLLYSFLINRTISHNTPYDLPFDKQQVLIKLFNLSEKTDFTPLKIKLTEALLKNWDYSDVRNLSRILFYTNDSNKEFVFQAIEKEKGNFSNISKFIYNMEFDEELTQLAKDVYFKIDTIDFRLFENKISSFNNYAEFRTKVDPDYLLLEWQMSLIKTYPISENKKYQIVEEVLTSNEENKFDMIFKRFTKEHKNEYYIANKEQILKDRYINSPKYGLKCLVSPKEHFNNFISRDRDNTAFTIGLINPINALGTIAALPIYVLIFVPLNSLP